MESIYTPDCFLFPAESYNVQSRESDKGAQTGEKLEFNLSPRSVQEED